MHLIWYNSVTKKYEYGNAKEYNSLKETSEVGESITILMISHTLLEPEYSPSNISQHLFPVEPELSITNSK